MKESKINIEINADGWKTDVTINGKTYTEQHVGNCGGVEGVEGNFKKEKKIPESVCDALNNFFCFDCQQALLKYKYEMASMRAIKFRGKRLESRTWIYGSLFNSFWRKSADGSRVCYIFPDNMLDNDNCWEDFAEVAEQYKVDPATVGQYTGLKDKKGKEIYEGDVLSVKWLFHVKWDANVAIWAADKFNNPKYRADLSFVLKNEYHELIGNIHDNPVLLDDDFGNNMERDDIIRKFTAPDEAPQKEGDETQETEFEQVDPGTKIYKCRRNCGAVVEKYDDLCPSCRQKFDQDCDRYRAMMKSVEGKSYKEQVDAINRFRAGY